MYQFSDIKAAEKIAKDLSSLSGNAVLPSDLSTKTSTKPILKEFLLKFKNKFFNNVIMF